MSRVAILGLASVLACSTEPADGLKAVPEHVCDARFAEDSGWCGGDPTGTWSYASACNRPVLEWLTATCPAGSFMMLPGRVTGELTLTSTSLEGGFGHDPEIPVTVELFEECIATLGTCPRSHMRQPLVCEGDFSTNCTCRIEPFEWVGWDSGEISIQDNMIAYEFDSDHRAQFCEESTHLYLDGIRSPEFETSAYFYILKR